MLYLCSCCRSWVCFQRAVVVIVIFCNIGGLPFGIQQGLSAPLARKALRALAPPLRCVQNILINVNTSHKKTSLYISCRKESGLNFEAHKLCHHSSKISLYLCMAANTTRKQQCLLLQAWPVWLSKRALLLLPPKTLTLPALWPFHFGAPPWGQQLLGIHVLPRDLR